MLSRFGKSSGPLLDARGHLLTVEGNNALVERATRIYECYRQQPRRTECKVCEAAIGGKPLLEKFGIKYFVCERCTHLNGEFEDTAAFNEFLYLGADGSGLVSDYSSPSKAAFDQRVRDIYAPKAQFLFDSLTDAGENFKLCRFAELGAGSGYFLAALSELGAIEVQGWDVSEQQVQFGNEMLGQALLVQHMLDDIYDIAASVEAEVVSMIFMLEHVFSPRRLMEALAQNSNVRYVFIAVPTVSPSIFIELAFPRVFERHLSTHTHLFTDTSLRWLTELRGFAPVGEWWFGADAMDLFRSIAVTLKQSGHGQETVDGWTSMMRPSIDTWQLALDKLKLSSEVHLCLRRA